MPATPLAPSSPSKPRHIQELSGILTSSYPSSVVASLLSPPSSLQTLPGSNAPPTPSEIQAVRSYIRLLTHHIDTIDAATTRAYNAGINPSHNVFRSLVSISGELAIKRTEWKAVLREVRLLPVEIVIEIVLCTLQLCSSDWERIPELIKLSSVSRFWNEVVVGYDAFWTKVDFRFQEGQDYSLDDEFMIQKILNRSGQKPLDITIRLEWDAGHADFINVEEGQEIPPVVLSPTYTSRWRSLSVYIDSPCSFPAFMTNPERVYPLPNLEAFHLNAEWDQDEDLEDLENMLPTITILLNSSPLKLTKLVLETPYLLHTLSLPDQGTSIKTFIAYDDYGALKALWSFPNLETLSLPCLTHDSGVLDDIDHVALQAARERTVFSTLKNLQILDGEISFYLKSYSFPSLTRLCLEDRECFLVHAMAEKSLTFFQAATSLTQLFLSSDWEGVGIPGWTSVLSSCPSVEVLGIRECSGHPILWPHPTSSDLGSIVTISPLVIHSDSPLIMPKLKVLYYSPHLTKMTLYLQAVKEALLGIVASRFDYGKDLDRESRFRKLLIIGNGTGCVGFQGQFDLQDLAGFARPPDDPEACASEQSRDTVEVVLDWKGTISFWPEVE